jgi:ATPase family associated with various cellular activities (AAA)
MELPNVASATLENLSPFKNEFRNKIKEHFGEDPINLALVTQGFAKTSHADVYLAVEDYVKGAGRKAQMMGLQGGGIVNFKTPALSELIQAGTPASMFGLGGFKVGPVQFINISLAEGRTLACVQTGLYLIEGGGPRLAVLLRSEDFMFTGSGSISLEVLAKERSAAETFLGDVRTSMGKRSIYRGKVLSLEPGENHLSGVRVKFHSLPKITRDKIILPEGLLKRIERQSVDTTKYREAMLAAGRRLKRGLLLHGSPGTGKTLTAMYIASQMEERTVLMMTGRGMSLLEQTCEMARRLEPALIIIEDVDLIGEERTKNQCTTPILFELLNQMDGLADDCDVMFLLTTNRPDILEPALAARPGRIDQAFKVPLPDAECRERLFELYSDKLTLNVKDMKSFIRRTDGASAAFINELMRKAALFAAPDGVPIVVEDRHMEEALHELAVEGGAFTRSLLGFRSQSEMEKVGL